MEDLNNVPSSGTYGAAINEVNSNFSLVVNAINSLEYATTKSKGIYNNGFTPSTTTLPNSVDGDWCMVLGTGNSFPARIWTFNGTTWAQGGQWNPDGINLNDYATTSALNTAVANSLLQATARMGYCEATISNTTIEATLQGYLLPSSPSTGGGNVRVKMPSKASVSGTYTLNINSTGAKEIMYNGLAVSPTNTWDSKEVVMVYYTNNKYWASNSQGGGGRAEKVSYNNSNNWIPSTNVQGAIDAVAGIIQGGSSESDLDVADEYGNVLAQFLQGHVRTKNFDSRDIKTDVEVGNGNDGDLEISDEQNNVLARFIGGHVKTKNFDSSELFKEKPSSGYELFYVPVDTYYNVNDSNSTSIQDGEDIKMDLGLIKFSTLYSSKEPSRLVLWAHGTSSGLHTNSQTITTDCDLSKALLKAGYSIFQVNGTPGEYGTDAGKHNISPIWYRSVLAAYKYLTDKYNFKRDGIFTFGMSLGSHASIQLNNYGTIPILAQVCFAGNLDIWKGSYGHYNTVAQRGSILDKFGMTENRPTLTTQNPPSVAEQEYILDNIDKWLPFNPITSGITNIDDIKTLYSVWLSSSTLYSDTEYELYKDKRITNKPPLMLIYGENDTTNPPRWGLYYYRMVKNGGGYVKLRRYTGATHETIFSAGVNTQTVINGETVSMCGSNYEAFLFLKRFDK